MEVCVGPRVTLLGVRVHVRPDGDTVEVRVTVPVNPLIGATVIVEVAAVPTVVVTAVGLADIVKSFGVKVTNAEWDSVPLVPVTVTVKMIAVLLVQESVDVWEAPRTTLVGLRVHVGPAGDTDEDSVTVPVNPLTGATVIVDVADVPGL